MKSIVYQKENQIALVNIPVPEVEEGKVLIRISHSGICGSDMTIFAGKHPRAKAPLVLGHEFSGYIASESEKFSEGDLVTVNPLLPCGVCAPCESGNAHVCNNLKLLGIDLDGGMAEYVLVPEKNVHLVPEGVSAKMAAFIEPVAVALHAVRLSDYKLGDKVVVFGAGGIGLSVALTMRLAGAYDLVISEPDEKRRKVAEDLGFDTIDSINDDVIEEVYKRADNGADIIFDCAGHQTVIDVIPDTIKAKGKIVIVAGYKNPPTMDFQKGMFREFEIQFDRNYSNLEFEMACDVISREKGYEAIVNCVLPPEKAEEGFAVPENALKVMFNFE